MKQQIITFETAKLDKEKGLEQDIYSYPKYSNENSLEYSNYKDGILAPTQSQLQKWLREVYNIYIDIESCLLGLKNIEYKFYIYDVHKYSRKKSIIYKTYEDALEIALQEALKLITV